MFMSYHRNLVSSLPSHLCLLSLLSPPTVVTLGLAVLWVQGKHLGVQCGLTVHCIQPGSTYTHDSFKCVLVLFHNVTVCFHRFDLLLFMTNN